MSGQLDFRLSIDRTAGLLTDTLCSARAARRGGLPPSHHVILSRAIRRLEGAQDDLYTVRNDPWHQPTPQKHQLELSL